MKYTFSNNNYNLILEELAEDYKNTLIETTLLKNNELNIDNINFQDLIKLDINVKENLHNQAKNNKLKRMSTAISLTGIIYSLFGLMLIMISYSDERFSESAMSVAFICIFLGFIVAIFGLMMQLLFKNKRKLSNKEKFINIEFSIINQWRIIEGLIYQISPDDKRFSLKTTISNLEQSKLITSEDVHILNELLLVRNIIMHNAPGKLVQDEKTNQLLIKSEELISKLSKLV